MNLMLGAPRRPLIVRELLNGSHRFSDLQRGLHEWLGISLFANVAVAS